MSVHVTCASCGAKNRLPAERLGDKPVCGKCKKPVLTAKPLVVSSANVVSLLNHNDLPVLVDCWASWCGPCKTFSPIFDQASAQWFTRLRFAKLDTEAHPSISQRWQIRSIPTLILFRDGRELTRVSGALPLPQLKQWLVQQGITL